MFVPRLAAGCILAVAVTIPPTFTLAEETAMPRIDSAAYVLAFESLINGHDPAAAAALVGDGFLDHAPWPGHTPDLAGFQAGFAEMLEAFPDLSAKVRRTVTEGDLLTVHFSMSGTNLGAFMGEPASGRTFEIEAIDILRLEDGKVVEHWGVLDAAAMMEQLGT